VLHEQDNEIVKVTSPLDHPITSGNLCIKGRFGFQFVQSREGEPPEPAEAAGDESPAPAEAEGDGAGPEG
jgi:Molybdopterin oxidoreductase Fe4S4 domain